MVYRCVSLLTGMHWLFSLGGKTREGFGFSSFEIKDVFSSVFPDFLLI